MEFRKIDINEKSEILSYASNDDLGWEYSVGCFLVWGIGDAFVSYDCSVPVIYMNFNNNYIFSPPYTKDKNTFVNCVHSAYEYCKTKSANFVMKGVKKEFAQLLQDDFKVKTSPNDGDYVYLTENLALLSGKKYHTKRNFVNRFEKLYDYKFVKYEDKYFNSCIKLLDEWISLHDNNSSERNAIVYALTNANTLELEIYIIIIDEKVVAFSIVDISGSVGHYLFEKASVRYEGVYQAINCYTCRSLKDKCKFINRQEDMGNEGLRKAKKSYHPIEILEKYTITK